jgi:hypothetical protein
VPDADNAYGEVKEHSTRSHIERIDRVAFPANRSRIASASRGARPGLVNRSTAAWLAATKVGPPSFHVLSHGDVAKLDAHRADDDAERRPITGAHAG